MGVLVPDMIGAATYPGYTQKYSMDSGGHKATDDDLVLTQRFAGAVREQKLEYRGARFQIGAS
jgi:hypothetical protein